MTPFETFPRGRTSFVMGSVSRYDAAHVADMIAEELDAWRLLSLDSDTLDAE